MLHLNPNLQYLVFQGPDSKERTLHSWTSSFKICRARKTRSRRNSFSFSGGKSGFPVGLTIPPEAMARSEPTSFATGIIVQICTTGICSRSISLLIAAPQRVLEPQVEVRMTPVTPADFSRSAMLWPMRVAFSTAAWAPPVAWMDSWSLPMTPCCSKSRITSRGTSRCGS